MVDNETVIRGLECCTAGDCEGCPYDGDGDLRGECIKRTQEYALNLIRKAQEQVTEPVYDGKGWSCGACGKIYRDVLDAALYKYCQGCGMRLIWIKAEEG